MGRAGAKASSAPPSDPMNVPCGCESRDQIMFQDGNLDKRQFVAGVAVAALVMFGIYKMTH